MEDEKKEEVNHGLKLIVKSSVIVFAALILSKIFGYIYRIIIARHFGPEVYGVFSLSMAIVGLLVIFSLMGFSEGIVRQISFYRGKNEINKIRYIYRFTSATILLTSIVISIFLFFSSSYISTSIFNNESLTTYLRILSFVIPLWSFAIYFLSIMRAFEKIKEGAIIDDVIQNVFKVVTLILLIFLGINSNAIIFSFFLGIFVAFTISYLYCRFKLPQIFLKNSLSKKVKHKVSADTMRYSIQMMFFGIMISIFYWIDSFAIGFFKSAVEVGLYNAVIPIALLFNMVPEMFLQLFFPLVTKEYSLKKFEFIKRTSKQIGKWIFMINLPMLFLMMLFPDVIIQILFGHEYIIATNSLIILSFGAIFSSVFMISNNLLSMAGKSNVILYDIILASLLNLILNIILIPMPKILWINNVLGINGAALATTTSLIVFNLLFLFQAKHYTSITPIQKGMFGIFLASLPPFILLFFLKKILEITSILFFSLSIMFLLIYLLLLFLFRAFDKEDVIILKSFKGKINEYLN